MNYEQLIEELREEMLQLVNTKCDALLQMYRSGEVHTSVKDTIRESSLITVSPAELKGKRPLAVQFAPGEWIETPIKGGTASEGKAQPQCRALTSGHAGTKQKGGGNHATQTDGL